MVFNEQIMSKRICCLTEFNHSDLDPRGVRSVARIYLHCREIDHLAGMWLYGHAVANRAQKIGARIGARPRIIQTVDANFVSPLVNWDNRTRVIVVETSL